jgi:hypothetical protein
MPLSRFFWRNIFYTLLGKLQGDALKGDPLPDTGRFGNLALLTCEASAERLEVQGPSDANTAC